MKKVLLCTLVFMSSLSLFAQEDDSVLENNEKNNEVKLNALYMVLGAFDMTYERLLNEESGVGIQVVIPYDGDISDDLNYFISPYYRLYFGKKYASGFFLEGFGLLSSVNRFESRAVGTGFDFVVETTTEKQTDFALGIGIGGKWITKSGFVGELNLGIGRNLTDSGDNGEDLVGKVGITVGYRF